MWRHQHGPHDGHSCSPESNAPCTNLLTVRATYILFAYKVSSESMSTSRHREKDSSTSFQWLQARLSKNHSSFALQYASFQRRLCSRGYWCRPPFLVLWARKIRCKERKSTSDEIVRLSGVHRQSASTPPSVKQTDYHYSLGSISYNNSCQLDRRKIGLLVAGPNIEFRWGGAIFVWFYLYPRLAAPVPRVVPYSGIV